MQGQTAVDLSEEAALAAAIEALSSGHVRVLAAKLRAALEARRAPAAGVVSLAAARRRR